MSSDSREAVSVDANRQVSVEGLVCERSTVILCQLVDIKIRTLSCMFDYI